MSSRFAVTLTSYGLLAIAGGVSFTLPDSLAIPPAMAQAPPTSVNLTGIVRDFLSSHPDFDTKASAGFGHYAGSVGFNLVDDRRPGLERVGYKVATEWSDASGRPIAPHFSNMFNPLGPCFDIPGIAAGGAVLIGNQSVIDSFDSRLGPYGGTNVGSNALISTNATGPDMLLNFNNSDVHGSVRGGVGGNMTVIYNESPNSTLSGSTGTLASAVPLPPMPAPLWLGPSTGDVSYGAGISVISTDMHVDNFDADRDATIDVKGDVTILCEGDLTLVGNGSASVTMNINGSLSLYVKGAIDIGDACLNMNTGDPSRLRIYSLAGQTIAVNNAGTLLVASIYAPQSAMRVRQKAEVFGMFAGKSIELDNQAKFHVDTAYSGSMNFSPDVAGKQGPSNTGGITSAATFDEWFRDALGVNLSAAHTIEMTRDAFGVYEFMDLDFRPIDNDLLGNEGGPRNDFFTYALKAEFTYDGCAGQFVELVGGDGTWVYIDDMLVIDLGGVMPLSSQRFDVDRLGLAEGETYVLHLFYAHRHPFSSLFRFRTNLELSTENIVPHLTAVFD